ARFRCAPPHRNLAGQTHAIREEPERSDYADSKGRVRCPTRARVSRIFGQPRLAYEYQPGNSPGHLVAPRLRGRRKYRAAAARGVAATQQVLTEPRATCPPHRGLQCGRIEVASGPSFGHGTVADHV